MYEFFNSLIPGIGINDILDIAVVAFLFYKVMGFIKKRQSGATSKRVAYCRACIRCIGYFKSAHSKLDTKKLSDNWDDCAGCCIPART
jgi:hypothetical protein